MNKVVMGLILLYSISSFSEDWSVHRATIQEINVQVLKLETELKDQVEVKKKSRDSARTEEVLQRIVEIHGELISYRRNLDTEKKHIRSEHPSKASLFAEKKGDKKIKPAKNNPMATPLGNKLDILLSNIRLKFSSFMEEKEYEEKSQEIVEVEEVIEKKMKVKKERESDLYLRRKSKIKLVK